MSQGKGTRTAEDVKNNPIAEDVARKGKNTREVISTRPLGLTGVEVRYRVNGKRILDCWISTWREWARDAEVIHVAE